MLYGSSCSTNNPDDNGSKNHHQSKQNKTNQNNNKNRRNNKNEYKVPKNNIGNFNNAKKILRTIYYNNNTGIYEKSNVTFYCGCRITYNGKKMTGADFKSCGFKPRRDKTRASRIEWEHIMPAYVFGHQLSCWQKGGRKNCSSNQNFNIMEGDMHNLAPAIGEVNADRSYFNYSQWTNKSNQYGSCAMVVDFSGKRVQPPTRARGAAARAYLYMSKRYNLKLSNVDRKLFDIWNQKYPPTSWECHRNQLIKKYQGNDNPYITAKCLRKK